MELRQAKDQRVAIMIKIGGVVTGYAAGIGILGHAVANSNEEPKTLIANVPTIVKWLLESGFHIGWPANLKTIGQYKESQIPFLPSLAY